MKTISNTILNQLAFTALFILLVAGINWISSCKKTNEATPNNVTVSGIFHGDTVWIYDTIPAKITFSFDELEDGTVKGGVWIRFLGNTYFFSNYKYRSTHLTSKWQEIAGGITMVEGRCTFDGDMAPLAFSGLITKNEKFEYAVASEVFEATGTANWSGPYLKPGVKTEQTKATGETNNCSDYVGNYNVEFSNCVSECSGYFISIGCWELAMKITSSSSNNCGGLDLQGFLNGTIPTIGQGNHVFEPGSEVYGGDLSITTDNSNNNLFHMMDSQWYNPCQMRFGGSFHIQGQGQGGPCIATGHIKYISAQY